MTNVIAYDITDPNLKQKLATLPEKMLEWAGEVLQSRAELMKGLAQTLVLVDTGSLRDSIRIERGGERLYWREYRVRAGGYVTNPKSGRLVDYAIFVEAKSPFMARAWASVQGDIAGMIASNVVEKANSE